MSTKLTRQNSVAPVGSTINTMQTGIRYFSSTRCVGIRPDWKPAKFPTVVRILPDIVEDGGKKRFAALRYGDAVDAYSSWYASLFCASYVGTSDNKQSFILFAADATPDQIAQNPYITMYNTIKRLSMSNRESIPCPNNKTVNPDSLKMLFKSTKTADGADTPLPDPKNKQTFVNVIPVMHRDTIKLGDSKRLRGCGVGDAPYVMHMSGSAFMSIDRQLRTRFPESDPLEMSNENGHYTVIYNSTLFDADYVTKAGSDRRAAGNIVDPAEMLSDSASGASGGSGQPTTFQRYEAAFYNEVVLPLPNNPRRNFTCNQEAFITRYADDILHNYDWVGSYLHLPTCEEIAKYIAYGFKDRPELVLLGLADTAYLDNEIMGILNNRVQVSNSAHGSSAATTTPSGAKAPRGAGSTVAAASKPAPAVDVDNSDPFGSDDDEDGPDVINTGFDPDADLDDDIQSQLDALMAESDDDDEDSGECIDGIPFN